MNFIEYLQELWSGKKADKKSEPLSRTDTHANNTNHDSSMLMNTMMMASVVHSTNTTAAHNETQTTPASTDAATGAVATGTPPESFDHISQTIDSIVEDSSVDFSGDVADAADFDGGSTDSSGDSGDS